MVRLAGEQIALRSLVFEDTPLLTEIAESSDVAQRRARAFRSTTSPVPRG
jgi:hypothetical protein